MWDSTKSAALGDQARKHPIEHDSLEKRNECLDDIRVALDQRLDGVRIAFPSCTKDSQL